MKVIIFALFLVLLVVFLSAFYPEYLVFEGMFLFLFFLAKHSAVCRYRHSLDKYASKGSGWDFMALIFTVVVFLCLGFGLFGVPTFSGVVFYAYLRGVRFLERMSQNG